MSSFTAPAWVVADQYLAELAPFDPEVAALTGSAPTVRLPDFSPEGFRARRQLADRTLAVLDAIPTADRDTLHAVMSERLQAECALYDCGFTTSLVAPLATPVHALRQLFDDLPAVTEDDWAVVAENLRAAAMGYQQYGATLFDSVGRGFPPAAGQVQALADSVAGWIDPTGADFYRSMLRRFSGPPALRRELEAAATSTSVAAAEFTVLLREQLLPRSSGRTGAGRERYAVTAAAFLGMPHDLDELYAFGWAELDRLRRTAALLARRITGSDDIAAARAELDRRPAGSVRPGDELVRWLQNRLDRTAETLQNKHFDIPAAHAKVQARMVTAGSGAIYYTPADAAAHTAGGRPARVWWSVPPGTERVPTWRQVSTIHHEGLPGHHLQHAVTAGLTGLHPWQRHLCHVHGYAEGWAHYAESLAVELELVRNDAELLGVLDAQLWRAARVVIDLGLHLDLPIRSGFGWGDGDPPPRWTPEAAERALVEFAGVDHHTAHFEVQRYLGWPGQALAFAVGAREFTRLRGRAEQQPGFDRAEFHARLLAFGPMGLAPLAAAAG